MLLRPVEHRQSATIRLTDRLAGTGIQPSVGAVGSSYDSALADNIIGLYRTELIHRGKPWRAAEDVETATARWVEWFNSRRIYSALRRYSMPALESAHYAQCRAAAID